MVVRVELDPRNDSAVTMNARNLWHEDHTTYMFGKSRSRISFSNRSSYHNGFYPKEITASGGKAA